MQPEYTPANSAGVLTSKVDDQAASWRRDRDAVVYQLGSFYDAVLGDSPVEVRKLDAGNRIESATVDSRDAFIGVALPFGVGDQPGLSPRQARGLYATAQALDPDLGYRGSSDLTQAQSGELTKDADVVRYQSVILDVDPVHIRGVRGLNASDAEQGAALACAADIRAALAERGWSPSAYGTSGNGGLTFYRIDLPVTPETTALMKRVLEVLHARFSDNRGRVDTTVHNPSRIARIFGTVNRKAIRHTPERPHRHAWGEHFDRSSTVVTEDQLRALIAEWGTSETPEPDGPETSKADPGSKPGSAEPTSDQERHLRRLMPTLADMDVGVTQKTGNRGQVVLVLDRCLVRTHSATDRGAAITIERNGRLGYRCQHASCETSAWANVRAVLGYGATASPGSSEQTRRRFVPRTISEQRSRPQPDWLWFGVIRQGQFAEIIADAGVGKTTLAIGATTAISFGVDYLGARTKRGGVAYFLGEGLGGAARRFDAAIKALGLSDDPENVWLFPDAPGLPREDDEVLDALRDLPDLSVVVFDTFSRVLEGDENSSEDAAAFVKAVDRIRSELGVTVLLLHHTNRAGSYRGSSVIRGAVDVEIRLEPTTHGVRVVSTKSRDDEAFKPFDLRRTRVVVGPAPTDDDPIDFEQATSVVFERMPEPKVDRQSPPDDRHPVEMVALATIRDAVEPWLTWTQVFDRSRESDVPISKGSFSRALSRLRERGYIDVEAKARTTYIAITDAGRQALFGGGVNAWEGEHHAAD